MKTVKNIYQSKQGFTLAEVLVSTGILTVIIIGLIKILIYCSLLADMSANITITMREAQNKLEEIQNSDYSSITTNYASGGTPGNTFNLSQGTGKGVIYMDASNPDLLKIEIDVSWKNKDGRVIGEDSNLNGVINTGEDLNSNGQLDSMAKIITLLAKK